MNISNLSGTITVCKVGVRKSRLPNTVILKLEQLNVTISTANAQKLRRLLKEKNLKRRCRKPRPKQESVPKPCEQ